MGGNWPREALPKHGLLAAHRQPRLREDPLEWPISPIEPVELVEG
jgi:hypothetical protein